MAEELPVEAMSPEASPRSAKSDTNQMKNLYFGTEEQSYYVSAYFPDSQRRPYNPDPLVMKDYTYGLYEEMMKDDQVKVALNLKKDLVIGSGWHIQSEDGDIKSELEELLMDETDRPFSEVLNDILQAYDFGFSLSEKIFKNLSDGRLALKDIKPRHPSTWLIHTDIHGNVNRFEQRGPQAISIDIDPNALIHYVNNQRHQNPYGESDLSTAYQAWMTKRHITRFYAIFLENMAGPKPVAKFDRRAPQAVVDELFNAIKHLQTKTALCIPKDFEMEFLETSNSGEAYIKGINLFNMFIGRSLFIPDLLGFSGGETGGGSFALGKEQIGLFYKHIYRRREILERLIEQHIIRPICVYNYGLLEEYPKFKFNPLSDEDASKQADMWIRGVQGVGYQPSPAEVNHFRELIKFPASEEVVMQADIAAQHAKDLAAVTKPPVIASPEEVETEEPEQEVPPPPKQFAYAYPLDSLPGDYKKKVDFKYANDTLKSAVSKILTEAQPVIEDIFEDLYSQIQKKKIIASQDITKFDSIQLKYLSRLQNVFKKHFRRLHDDGRQMAKTEVTKQAFAAGNIPSEDFLQFLEDETYAFVGDWSYGVTKTAKNKIVQAIKDGDSLPNVIRYMDDAGVKLSDTQMERYARTKTTEVFNKGRKEYFDETGVVEAYQYSAILDDVTSEICGQLNGLTFPASTCPIPPLHFNCRSVLIPITKFEEWSEDKVTNGGKNIDKFLEKNVSDKGFAVYKLEEEIKEEVKPKYIPPQITDPAVTFKTEINGVIETTTYSFNGEAFQITTTEYFDEEKKKIKLVDHKRLDDERSL